MNKIWDSLCNSPLRELPHNSLPFNLFLSIFFQISVTSTGYCKNRNSRLRPSLQSRRTHVGNPHLKDKAKGGLASCCFSCCCVFLRLSFPTYTPAELEFGESKDWLLSPPQFGDTPRSNIRTYRGKMSAKNPINYFSWPVKNCAHFVVRNQAEQNGEGVEGANPVRNVTLVAIRNIYETLITLVAIRFDCRDCYGESMRNVVPHESTR